MDDGKQLAETIRRAFSGVTNEGGTSWAETVWMDSDGLPMPEPEPLVAWETLVDDPDWDPDGEIGGFAHLDPIGFRFYLPAAMLRALQDGDGRVLRDFLDSIANAPEHHRFIRTIGSALNDAQRAAVVEFLRGMAERTEGEASEAWRVALTPYWDAPARKPDAGLPFLKVEELWFDREFIREFLLRTGPVQPWPFYPPFDEHGHRDDFRGEEDAIPRILWSLPENQSLIETLSGWVFNWLYENDGLLVPVDAPIEGLARLDVSRHRTQGMLTVAEPYEEQPEWPAVLKEIGWAFVLWGEDGLWGTLYASHARRDLIDAFRSWRKRA